MALKTASPARLWTLLARDEPVGVIFRRGPSKQVVLIKWNTEKDTFEIGQWFKGRVYERRCDISPNGELLIYFAAKQKPPLYSWTAISKPPYFTALALWPKGDCWNGGGWFIDDKKVRLNHGANQAQLAPNFRLQKLKVVGFAEFGGEDSTVWDITLARDGWTLLSEGESRDRGGIKGWRLDPARRWQKRHPSHRKLLLEMAIVGIGGKGAPWYKTEYRVFAGESVLANLGLSDWADWDHRGDLVFARKGCVFRQSLPKAITSEPQQIADFNKLKFEEVIAPPNAQRW